MIRFLIYILIFFLLISCKYDNNKARDISLDTSSYNKNVVHNLHKYVELKNFLINHVDTIISYRNDNNIVSRTENDITESKQENNDCYSFFNGNPEYDLTNVPLFLYPKLDSLYRTCGQDLIYSFTICQDSTLTIQINNPSIYNSDEIAISHSLSWNKKYTIKNDVDCKSCDPIKDTILGNNWKYLITVKKYRGI